MTVKTFFKSVHQYYASILTDIHDFPRTPINLAFLYRLMFGLGFAHAVSLLLKLLVYLLRLLIYKGHAFRLSPFGTDYHIDTRLGSKVVRT